jgi:NitT/TauT family transport system ATP-binding protein
MNNGQRTTDSGRHKLDLSDISMIYRTRRGGTVVAVDRLDLHVGDREFVSIVGPSGCGKSTVLRMVAGLVRASSGVVLLDGTPVTEPGADRGMVFQSYTLFHWLTVQRNVEFGLRLKHMPAAERVVVARRYLDLVGLNGFERSYPKELSGGMMQRVALARALANDPDVLLMDEPFGALDAQTRVLMQELLLDLWQQQPKTILFVTHDIEESIFLSDRIYVMSARPGRIKAEIVVPLPRPRTLDATSDPAFVALKREIFGLIREESEKAITMRAAG